MGFFNYSSELVGFNEFPFLFDFASIHSSIRAGGRGRIGGQLPPPLPQFLKTRKSALLSS